MSLRRPYIVKGNNPAPAPDVETVDVTRLTVGLDVGVEKTFNIEDTHSFTEDDLYLRVVQGTKRSRIKQSRIVYTEVDTVKMNRVKPSGSI